MDNKLAQQLVTKTRDDYNRISGHFSSTRQFVWPDIAEILDSLKIQKGMKILDMGCGNGRFAKFFIDKGADYYGHDISEKLIKIAKTNNPKGYYSCGDLLKTPFKTHEFDLVISVATLHHIPSNKLRSQAIIEMRRVLKPGGTIIISVWYFWSQLKYLKFILREEGRRIIGISKLDFGDFMMPWRDEKQVTQVERYMHSWKRSELKRGLTSCGFKEITFAKKKKSHNLIIIAK